MIENIIKTFIILMFLHALADFVLQSDAMAKGKNRVTQKRIFDNLPLIVTKEDPKIWPLEKIKEYELKYDCKLDVDEIDHVEFREKYRLLPDGQKFINCWFYWLSAHALIHGGVIMMVFPEFWYLGLIEIISHFTIDSLKTHNKINIHADQIMHLWWKIMYLIIMVIV